MAYGITIYNSAGAIILDAGYAPFDFIESFELNDGDVGSKTYDIGPGSVLILQYAGHVPPSEVQLVNDNKIQWDLSHYAVGYSIHVSVYRGELL